MKRKGGVEILDGAVVVNDLMSVIGELGILFDFGLKERQEIRINFTEMEFVFRPQ